MQRLPEITVHGRFQPPLHENHWQYVKTAFEMADHVELLIANPSGNEAFEETASWRSDPVNNPFTYDQRVQMFTEFFDRVGIVSASYNFKPFNIKDPASFSELDRHTPNLVNVYSKWSAKKWNDFKAEGLPVINPDLQPSSVTGSMIREIIRTTPDLDLLPRKLVEVGFVPKAIPGLLDVLRHSS